MRLPPHSAELALLGRLLDVKFQDLTPHATALLFAIESRHSGIAKALIDEGANVNARTITGDTPLVSALENTPNVEIVKLLLEKGASLKVKSSDFMRRVIKKANSELLELLKEHGLNQTD